MVCLPIVCPKCGARNYHYGRCVCDTPEPGLYSYRDGVIVPMTWRPIEMAPKDGSAILSVMADGAMRVVRYNEEISWWVTDETVDGNYDEPPTHWMPLPGPPK
jgi:hypothetical protein